MNVSRWPSGRVDGAATVVVACSESAASRRLATATSAAQLLFNFGAVLPFDAEADLAGVAAMEQALAAGARRVVLVGHAGCRLHTACASDAPLASRAWIRSNAVPKGELAEEDPPLDKLHLLWQLARFESSALGAKLRALGGGVELLWIADDGAAFAWRETAGTFVPVETKARARLRLASGGNVRLRVVAAAAHPAGK